MLTTAPSGATGSRLRSRGDGGTLRSIGGIGKPPSERSGAPVGRRRAPFLLSQVPVLNNPWFGIVWFTLKLFALLFFFIWLRGTLPRLRYDKFMKLGWLVLIPVSLVWLLIVATFRALRMEGVELRGLLLIAGAVMAVILIASFFWPQKKEPAAEEREAGQPALAVGNRAFPVPALPGEDELIDTGRDLTRA